MYIHGLNEQLVMYRHRGRGRQIALSCAERECLVECVVCIDQIIYSQSHIRGDSKYCKFPDNTEDG